MRFSRLLSCLPLVLLLVSAGWADASTRGSILQPAQKPVPDFRGMAVMSQAARQVSESLREDVTRHPNDFVVFETRGTAERFLEEHKAEVSRETEPRMIQSGVLGYWRAKTVVVLPVFGAER